MVNSKHVNTKEKRPSNEYEALRMARMAENEARIAKLSLPKLAEDLKVTAKRSQSKKKYPNNADESVGMAGNAENQDPLPQSGVQNQGRDMREILRVRQSPNKFKNRSAQKSAFEDKTPHRRSERLKNRTSTTSYTDYESSPSHTKNKGVVQSDTKKNYHYGTRNLGQYTVQGNAQLLPREMFRGTGEDSGCHFCNRTNICKEENCERCVNRDSTKACLGRTDCSVCHSDTGVFCRRCLKLRYGEDLETVRENKNWMCPHCSEERGIKPYWICNSFVCLVIRKIPSISTGISIRKAEEMGFECVADYLADLLEKQASLKK